MVIAADLLGQGKLDEAYLLLERITRRRYTLGFLLPAAFFALQPLSARLSHCRQQVSLGTADVNLLH